MIHINRPAPRRPTELTARDVWNTLMRHRLLIALTGLGTAALVFVISLLSTPVYQAYTSLEIQDQAQMPLFDQLQGISGEGGNTVATHMQVLGSRTLAEQVVDTLALQVVVTEPERVPRAQLFSRVDYREPVGPERLRTRLFELSREGDGFVLRDEELGRELGTVRPGQPFAAGDASLVLDAAALEQDEIRFEVQPTPVAVAALRRTVDIGRPDREADIVSASYESTDRELVHRVPNALADAFIARRQRLQRVEASNTVEFLQGQIALLAGQLRSAEDDLRDFRRGANLVNPEAESRAQVEQLAALQAQRNMLNVEREAMTSLLREVEAAPAAEPGEASPYRRLIAFPSLLRNPAASELLSALSPLENQRAELLGRRTHDDPDVQVLSRRIREIEGQLRSIAVTYLQGLTDQVTSIDATLGRFTDRLSEVPSREIELARLVRQTELLGEMYVLLQTRLKEAEIARAGVDQSVQVVDPAAPPRKPVRPRPLLNGIAGLMVGLLLGALGAFGWQYLDTKVHTREELAELTGLPVLGVIPPIVQKTNGRRVPAHANGADGFAGRLVTNRDPRNPVSEAYRSLRTNITFSRIDQETRSIVFTSPLPGDGKTTSCANLAITLAQMGHRTLLIDADLRRGLVNELFDLPRSPGLSDVILGQVSVDDALHQVQLGGGHTLDFLSTGTLPPNPSELLGSRQSRELMTTLRGRYDAVLSDAPPLNLVTDAAILGTEADGVLLVARAGRTERDAIAYAMDQLRRIRAPVLGTVLNDVDVRQARFYGSSYGYYGETP